MTETITLSKETYDSLMQDRIELNYLKDCLMRGVKTHEGDFHRALFIFETANDGSVMINAYAESEAINELSKINKELYELNNSRPIYNHLFLNLYAKQ